MQVYDSKNTLLKHVSVNVTVTQLLYRPVEASWLRAMPDGSLLVGYQRNMAPTSCKNKKFTGFFVMRNPPGTVWKPQVCAYAGGGIYGGGG